MQYLGGKSRIANSIAKIINENDCEVFVSLFCGSCAVETKVKESKKILKNSIRELLGRAGTARINACGV